MELWQLRYFVKLAETLNFHQAAQQLHIAQPGLSRQIQNLEDELGVPLFVRNSKVVALTDSGRLLLPSARSVLRSADEIKELMMRSNDGDTGKVSIGVARALALSDTLRSVFVKYARRFPNIELQCVDMSSSDQNRALRMRQIDIALMRPPVDSHHFDSIQLFEEKFVVILPKSSLLASRSSVQLIEVADQPLLMPKGWMAIEWYDKTIETYHAIGRVPNIVHTDANADDAGAILVEAGKGIYILPHPPDGEPDFFGKGVVAVPLSDPVHVTGVYIAWRKNEMSIPILNYIQVVRDAFMRDSG
jgi:DNA-binding transcriptional LysR family regulator